MLQRFSMSNIKTIIVKTFKMLTKAVEPFQHIAEAKKRSGSIESATQPGQPKVIMEPQHDTTKTNEMIMGHL